MQLERIRTTLSDFRAERGHASFVFTPSDQTGMGMVAIAAAALGQAGAASGLLVQSSDVEEAAYQVSFTLDGKPASGWLWFAPFGNGDEVDVAARWQGDHYEVMAMVRPSERTVALYPHLSRGRKAHWKAVWKIWFWGVTVFGGGATALIVAGALILDGFDKVILYVGALMICVFYVFFAFPALQIGFQRMKFVKVAERAFRALGWKDVENINLVKSSKPRRPDDPPELGTFYFRY